jgi:hypothetical protein
MGAAALTAFGVDKSDASESETTTPYGSNTSEVKFSENNHISSSLLIALDPAGDEHPAWVDFTQVYMESNEVNTTFRFHISGNPAVQNTKLKTDTAYAIVFIDKETRVGKNYVYAFGGQKTKDVGVQAREFSEELTGFDNQDINTIPNNGAKSDKIIYEAGEEAVTTKNGEVAFTVPQDMVDKLLKGNDICVWTTEGTGHGNEVKKENGIQAFNKDHSCQFLPSETPKPTPIAPVPTPEIPKGLPETGVRFDREKGVTVEWPIVGLAGGGILVMGVIAAEIGMAIAERRERSKENRMTALNLDKKEDDLLGGEQR